MDKETKQIVALVVIAVIGVALVSAGVFGSSLTQEQAAHLVDVGVWTIIIAISLVFVIL